MHFLYLAISIIAEVIATSALKAADGFTNPIPSVIVVVGYAIAFYFLSITLRSMPVGIVYAIWSGVGVVLISLAGWLLYRQTIDVPAIIGLVLIVSGVIVINLFSSSIGH